MLINKAYVCERMSEIIREKQSVSGNTKLENQSSYKRLFSFWEKCIPVRFRKLLTPFFHPLLSAWRNFSQKKKTKLKNKLPYFPLSVFSTDFMRYCFEENPELDTSLYFDREQDEDEIKYFLDNKIKCFIAGFDYCTMTETQKKDVQWAKSLRKKARISQNGFRLRLPERDYYLPHYNHFTTTTFIYHYGLKVLDGVASYIKGKDFLDIGALYGDVSMMFLQYNPQKVYAYEPVMRNFGFLTDTILKNKVENRIEILRKGLGDKPGKLAITQSGGGASFNRSFQGNAPTEEVEVSTIDHECADRNVGLIKMDVEGFEYFVLKGGLETIRRDHPVLLVSIYHTGKDFFEIPPMIQNCCPGYRFRFVDILPSNILGDKILVGYDHSVFG